MQGKLFLKRPTLPGRGDYYVTLIVYITYRPQLGVLTGYYVRVWWYVTYSRVQGPHLQRLVYGLRWWNVTRIVYMTQWTHTLSPVRGRFIGGTQCTRDVASGAIYFKGQSVPLEKGNPMRLFICHAMVSDGHLHLKKGSLPNKLPFFKGRLSNQIFI